MPRSHGNLSDLVFVHYLDRGESSLLSTCFFLNFSHDDSRMSWCVWTTWLYNQLQLDQRIQYQNAIAINLARFLNSQGEAPSA